MKGNLNISRKRLLQTTEEGGLGLFNLRDFLDAQRCSWVTRAQNLDDNWKRCLYAGCYGNILNLRASNIDQRCTPILHKIALSYERFFACHTKWTENFKQALVFDNPALTTNLRTDEYANMEFFGVGKISGIDANFLDPAGGFEGGFWLEVDIGHERHMASNGIQGCADIFEVASIFDGGGRDSHDLATDLNEAERLLHAGIGIHRVTGEHRLDADGIFSPNGRTSAFHFAGWTAERVTAEAGLHHFVS